MGEAKKRRELLPLAQPAAIFGPATSGRRPAGTGLQMEACGVSA